MKLLKRAGKFALFVLGSVSGVASLVFGLSQNGTAAIAWIGISLVLLAFFGYLGIAGLITVVTKLRSYDSAVSSAATSRGRLERVEADLLDVPRQLEEERKAGRLDAIGAFLASSCDTELRVSGMTMAEGTIAVVAVADGILPILGARYLLQSREMKTRRGVVALETVREDGKLLLTVRELEPGSEAFWKEAHKQAGVTESTPGNLELVPDPLILELTERAEI